MIEVERIPYRQRWRLIQWPLMWSLAVVAFGLGIAGFANLTVEPPLSVLDMIYGTLQLFLLGGNIPRPMNWQLEIARFLGPGVMAYTATQALIVLFREQLTLLRLRFRRGHVIVCGLGRTGFKVVSDFLRRGGKVVVIEEDDESDWISMSKDLGATVLIGDATDRRLLDQARIRHAGLLIAVCGNDGTNVEVAVRAYQLKRASSPVTGPVLKCHVHIVEPDLRALFKEHRVFTDTGDRCRMVLFNIYDSSARLVMRLYPLDRERISPDDPRTVHLIVIGFGLMGESLVLRAARNGHFANCRRLRVTVVDRDSVPQERRFLRRYPGLDAVCDITFLTREADDAETVAEITAMSAEPDTLPTVAICVDDDTRGLSLALGLLPALKPLKVPILLRMSTEGGLTTLLDADIAASRLSGLVRPFPVIGLSSGSDVLLHQEMDAGARAIHADYVANRHRGSTVPDDPTVLPWDDLNEDLKDSNRHQADHIEVKLRAIGLTASTEIPGTPVTAFAAEEIEVLARMEHARWNAERFLAGWTGAPKRDIELKTSPWLVPWDDLPENIREYDRGAVRNIPRFVELSGRHICRPVPQ